VTTERIAVPRRRIERREDIVDLIQLRAAHGRKAALVLSSRERCDGFHPGTLAVQAAAQRSLPHAAGVIEILKRSDSPSPASTPCRRPQRHRSKPAAMLLLHKMPR